MSLLSKVTAYWSPPELTAEELTVEKLTDLLAAVLPTFIAIARDRLNSLPDEDECKSKSTASARDLHCRFQQGAENLRAQLRTSDLDSVCTPLDELKPVLLRVLFSLENSFTSWSKPKYAALCGKLGMERNDAELFPKLHALLRVLPDDDEVDGSMLVLLEQVVRPYSSRDARWENIIYDFYLAFDLLDEIQPHDSYALSPCPRHFSYYPVKDVWKFSKTLFSVLEKCWECKCNTHQHLNRAMKLNLTQHQRFETAPVNGKLLPQRKAQFRIMFPTKSGSLRWQDADIAVTERAMKRVAPEAMKDNLCDIIEEAKSSLIPNMVVYQQALWQLQSQIDMSKSMKVPDANFKTLRDLLQINDDISFMGRVSYKCRTILATVIVTSFLHLYNLNQQIIQAALTINNICFYRQHQLYDIMRPYLNMEFVRQSEKQSQERDLNTGHWLPNVLSLGVLLLQIFTGRTIDFSRDEDDCIKALSIYEDLSKFHGRPCGGDIPDGCFQAIFACLQPDQLASAGLAPLDIKDGSVRRYIFERILCPLEEVLSEIYGVPLYTLSDTITDRAILDAGSTAEERTAVQAAGRKWLNKLKPVHDALYHPLFDSISADTQRGKHVKIAVLDTGMQLPSALQENYIDVGKLASTRSKSFCSENDTTWDTDKDGHGTNIGEIVLNIAPKTELFVAKVCNSRRDFTDPRQACQTQGNIADAIHYAATVWKVDMIVMSFGFDRHVYSISQAMDAARQATQDRILFFAATCNDGAHTPMAWPARDLDVFGVSSTDGDGQLSSFNPDENDAPAILYALGEGVEVTSPSCKTSGTMKKMFVSGTSYAAPVAAGLAANVLVCVRLGVAAMPPERAIKYASLPTQLQQMKYMSKVLLNCMRRNNQKKKASLLPWDFLKAENVADGSLLQNVYDAVNNA